MLLEYSARWIGRTVPVLLESVSSPESSDGAGWVFSGLSPSFLRVTGGGESGADPEFSAGDEVLVRITGSRDDSLKGRLIQ